MKYKNKKSKLNIICVLFVFLLNSSIASAQTVEVTEKTPAQLLDSANAFLENNDINMKFTSPILDNTSDDATPYLDVYITYFYEYKEPFTKGEPLLVELFVNKMGAVSKIEIMQEHCEKIDGLGYCLTSLYGSLGLTSEEIAIIFKTSSVSDEISETGVPYYATRHDIYSLNMKRRFLAEIFITMNDEKFLLAKINAIDN